MKRTVLTIVIMTFLLLAGCGSSADHPGATDPGSPVPSTKEASTNETLLTTEFQPVQLNESFSTEDAEIIFTNKSMTSAANWERDDGTKLSLAEKNGQMYFIIIGSAKNLATTEIDLYNGLEAEIVMDGKYKYPVSIDPASTSSIVPLKTVSFMMYAEMPKEVLEECKEYQLLFGFNQGFAPATDVYSCENCYAFSGTVDEYGSADSIQNFQTFKEFIVNEAEKHGYDYEVVDSVQDVQIGGNTWVFETEDGTTFSIKFWLDLNYMIYKIYAEDGENAKYGDLHFEIEELAAAEEASSYIGASLLKLTSDNGTMEMDSTASGYDFDADMTFLTSTASFQFTQRDYSFTELESILNGENVKIIIGIEQMDHDELIMAEMEPSAEELALMQSYLEFYKTLPLVQFD